MSSRKQFGSYHIICPCVLLLGRGKEHLQGRTRKGGDSGEMFRHSIYVLCGGVLFVLANCTTWGRWENGRFKVKARGLPYMTSATISDVLTPSSPCHVQNSRNLILFVCFLGTPSPLGVRTSYMVAPLKLGVASMFCHLVFIGILFLSRVSC